MQIVVFQLYEKFTASSYMAVCVSLASPFLLQPVLFPLSAERDAERNKPTNNSFFTRYSLKANVWIAIFSFVGNYWYTHYFYSVLGYSGKSPIFYFIRATPQYLFAPRWSNRFLRAQVRATAFPLTG
jgi:cycloeucalenol cycloisomerase